jgi:putative inorganic carbon (hco3(-)) transporter
VTTLAARPLRIPDSASLFGGLVVSALLGVMIVQQPLLGFAAVFGIALAFAVLAFPDLAIFAVTFLIYTNAAAVAVKYHSVPYTAGILIPALLIIPVAYHFYRRRPVIADAAMLAVILFLFVQLVSTLLADDQGYAFGEMRVFVVEGVAIYLLIRNAVRTVNVLRLVVWTMLLAGVLMAAVVIFQEVTASYSKPFLGFGQVGREWFIGHASNPRLSGPIGDPNYFAQILLVLVPIGLLRFFGERTMPLRLLAAGATGVIAFALTLTFSRGAGVAFVVVLVLMTVFRYIPLYQLLIVVLGLVLLLSFVPAYKERVATLGSFAGSSDPASEGVDQSVRSRTTEMKAATLVFLDHPLVGVGPGSFPLYYQEYANRVGLDVHEAAQSGARRGEEARRESHNIFLSIAADLGILGLASFLAILYLTFRRLNRSRKRWLRAHPEAANLAASFLLGLAAYLTSGLFLTLAFERYFWLLLALAGSAATLDLKDEEALEPVRERETVRPVRRAPARRARPTAPVRRRPRVDRPARRPQPTTELPLRAPPPPVEVVPPAPPVEVVPPAPPAEVVLPPRPVEAEPIPAPAPLVPATVVIDVTLDEAEQGVTKFVEVPHVEACPVCEGHGSLAAGQCPSCEGIGRHVSWTAVSVEIPRDVKDGQRVQLPALGGDAEGGYALLCVESDPNDKIIRYVAYTELAGALAFIGYLYFLA